MGMPWPQKGATYYHAQLGLSDKGCVIKVLVVCYVVWLGSMIYGGWVFVVVRMAFELKYRNTQYIHAETYGISSTIDENYAS